MISIAKLKTKSQAMQNVFHLLIALQVFVEGWDKAEHFHQYPLRVIFLFLMGVLIVAGVVFHHALEKRIKNFDGLYHLFEGLVFIVVATILWEEGRWRIPVFYFFIGGTYLIMGLIQLLSRNLDRDEVGFRLQFVIGILFLTAAPATVAWNFLKVHNKYLVVIAVLFTILGIFNLWLRRKLMRKKRERAGSELPGSTDKPVI